MTSLKGVIHVAIIVADLISLLSYLEINESFHMQCCLYH